MNPDKFKFIYNYLYHSGPYQDRLSPAEHNHLFSLGDGYGKMTVQQLQANGLTYDFSHIRDSSDEALERIYKELRNIVSQKV